MSRSYKKHPYITDHTRRTTKYQKQLANRAFRRRIAREEDMPSRPSFKKYTDSWVICDYKWRMSRAEAIQYYTSRVNDICWSEYVLKGWPTLKDYMRMWEKYHYRK